MSGDPKKSQPPDPKAAKQLGQDLISQLKNDFAVHKPTQLGQDLIAQLQHDFGTQKKADDQKQARDFAQALLGKVSRDFASGRPPPMPETPPEPGAPVVARPVTLAPPPDPEVEKAEAELARAAEAPLAADEAADLEAMQGNGAFGFFRRLLGR